MSELLQTVYDKTHEVEIDELSISLLQLLREECRKVHGDIRVDSGALPGSYYLHLLIFNQLFFAVDLKKLGHKTRVVIHPMSTDLYDIWPGLADEKLQSRKKWSNDIAQKIIQIIPPWLAYYYGNPMPQMPKDEQPEDKAPGNPVSPDTIRRYHNLAKTTDMSANSIQNKLKTSTRSYYDHCKEITGEEAILMGERAILIKKEKWLVNKSG